MTLPQILVVDDQFARNATERSLFLRDAGLVEAGACSGGMQQALAEVTFCSGQRREGNRMINDPNIVLEAAGGNWALVLLDVQFDSGELDSVGRPSGQAGDDTFGLTVYKHLKTARPNLAVVLLSGKRQEEIAEDKTGAPYLSKRGLTPYEMRRALASYGTLDPQGTHTVLDIGVDIIAEAPGSLAAFGHGFVHAGSDASILILGESGVGKEVLARYLHRASPRSSGPFLAVNVAAIPSDLVESELFGIGKNVASSVDARMGKFELAAGGTLFLDEIGDMPLDVQAKVLRALQERKIVRVGEVEEVPLDIRLISATSRDLSSQVVSGGFRGDLLYRINTVPISIPPLRERRQDTAPLARSFLNKFATTQGKIGVSFSANAIAALEAHSFPGNVRELGNLVERLVSATGHHQLIGDREIRETLGMSSNADLALRSPSVLPAVAPSSMPDKPGAPSLAELADWLDQIPVAKDDPALKGVKPKLDEAVRRLVQRLAGAALERCRDPNDQSLNRQSAVRYLTGDGGLKGKAPARIINEILGRAQESALSDADLQRLIDTWRGESGSAMHQ